jgi:hypothetical protein
MTQNTFFENGDSEDYHNGEPDQCRAERSYAWDAGENSNDQKVKVGQSFILKKNRFWVKAVVLGTKLSKLYLVVLTLFDWNLFGYVEPLSTSPKLKEYGLGYSALI